MQTDIDLFRAFESGNKTSTLRIYSWQPKCISYGYSQNIEKELDVERAKQLGWDIVKRPTGGGIVFHNEAEVTYSLITEIDNPKLPKGLVPAYKKISEAVVFALSLIGVRAEIRTSPRPSTRLPRLRSAQVARSGHPSPSKMERGMNSPQAKKGVRSLCFAVPAEYEIVVAGKKIVGSAQKRGKQALLQQGSIFVRNMAANELELLKTPNQEYNSICVEEVLDRRVGFDELSRALVAGFKNVLNCGFEF